MNTKESVEQARLDLAGRLQEIVDGGGQEGDDAVNLLNELNELFCPDWAECDDRGRDPLAEGSQFLDEFENLKSRAEELGV